jgi:hypothetical protein
MLIPAGAAATGKRAVLPLGRRTAIEGEPGIRDAL